MTVISDVCIIVTLPSGNKACYQVQPQHLPREGVPESYRWPIHYGRQIAHELDGRWYKPHGWEEITDHRTLALIERCPEFLDGPSLADIATPRPTSTRPQQPAYHTPPALTRLRGFFLALLRERDGWAYTNGSQPGPEHWAHHYWLFTLELREMLKVRTPRG